MQALLSLLGHIWTHYAKSDIRVKSYLQARTRMLVLCTSLCVMAPVMAQNFNGFVIAEPLVPIENILHGGPPRDGIPALNRPDFVSADDAGFMRKNNRVIGVEVGGVARAYPIKILNYHEIVNDVVNGKVLVISYCPLCGSGMVFDANAGGRELNFGVSGLLYNSDVLLFDRQTESLWSQIRGQAVSGPLKGTNLRMIAASHTTWRDWKNEHPETTVLSINTGHKRSYELDPYQGYERTNKLYSPVSHDNSQYMRKTLTLGLEINGNYKAYPFKELRKGPAEFKEEFEGTEITIQYDHKNKTARVLDHDGEEIPTVITYWFAWYTFHPETEIHTAKK